VTPKDMAVEPMAEEINVRSSFHAFLVALVWNTDSYYQTAVRYRATMVLTKTGDTGLEEEEEALVVALNGAAVELEELLLIRLLSRHRLTSPVSRLHLSLEGLPHLSQ
jgi:hypothetical protein